MTCLTVGLNKWAKKKESEDIKNNIKKLGAIPTFESYDEIVSICEDAYSRKVDRSYFNSSLVENAKMQAYIIRTLANGDEYTVSAIKESKYFSGQYVADKDSIKSKC